MWFVYRASGVELISRNLFSPKEIISEKRIIAQAIGGRRNFGFSKFSMSKSLRTSRSYLAELTLQDANNSERERRYQIWLA